MADVDRTYIEELKKNIQCRPVEVKDVRTTEQIEREKRIHAKALEIGINLKMTDGEIGDSYYRNQALLYILDEKEIPEELMEKVREEMLKSLDRPNQTR